MTSDMFAPAKRSSIMASVKGRGNASTETVFLRLLRREGLSGWRRHLDQLPGRPDFVFKNPKVAVFLDGCFWHGCKCKCIPVAHRNYWQKKIANNRRRDRVQTRALAAKGWRVIRFWEHQLRLEPERCLAALRRTLD